MKYQQLPRKYLELKLQGKPFPTQGHELAGRTFSQLKHFLFRAAYLQCFPDADRSEVNMNFSIYEESPVSVQPKILIELMRGTARRERRPMRVKALFNDCQRPNGPLVTD
ncbi:hypothetical protein [Denitromonas ohlonensis]|uniref:Uncharacterized protein n=2 Tax=Denitromonas TaxID=139331 RepID=A0A558CIW2_9RHOO|nr:hypothetical protein [Denitromonas ohlonensis]TVT48710.1 MAG: hypothetical protein FHP94_09415 [Denitromonas halophila]TVO63581.1 hypothetical protein FHP90_13975 [Denitromonas ohlonensis]TVO75458.1 hypothetical protein FHP89_14010 [Denitromonas ohlonensis]TVT70546.1 MAG: hypothetical protein FHP92_17600 [Denitromonas halophila]TVT75668.1 MAG: hypothetical protein FHP93_00225 [Denitromonas halophila]